MPEDRRMTFIVVPHDRGFNTRSFEVSYRRLRVAAILAGVWVLVFAVMAVSWGYVAGQAARVPQLQGQIAELEADRERVEQLARLVARMEAEYEKVRVMLGADAPPRRELDAGSEDGARTAPAGEDGVGPQSSLPHLWPLEARGHVTRGHLARLSRDHPGMDIAVPFGTRILAAGAGTVAEVGEDSVYGRFIRLAHPEGYETLYAHASSLVVRAQERVREGQVIALSGSTGVSTAPHLHFEIRKDGRPVDPGTLIGRPE